MPLSLNLFRDSPEYTARLARGPLPPPDIPVKLLHAAVPLHLYQKSTIKSAWYLARHLACMYVVYRLGCAFSNMEALPAWAFPWRGTTWLGTFTGRALCAVLWLMYWSGQGMIFAGVWCLGHEAGHNAIFSCEAANTAVGVLTHTFVLTPYAAWRATHATHHKATNDLGRDETYIPPTRSARHEYVHALEETPIGTIVRLFIRQFFGFQLYLLHNRKGNPRYPAFTSHYNPSAALFKSRHYKPIVLSNLSLVCMLLTLGMYARHKGWRMLCLHYILPWLWAHNWIVLFTYLQHTDPLIPYYRGDKWTFTRGALATVDRPLFGWAGRFFLHNISTDHVAHHFFPSIPFYNLPEVTAAIKPVLGDHYHYDTTPALYALWRSFTQCIYVDKVDGNAEDDNLPGAGLEYPKIVSLDESGLRSETSQSVGGKGEVLYFKNCHHEMIIRARAKSCAAIDTTYACTTTLE